MEIIRKKENETVTLHLSGRLDTITAPTLEKSLLAEFENEKNVELDFSDLFYVSSAGLRVLLLGQKTAKSKNAHMAIKNVSVEIMEVLKMTGFTNILNVE